MMCHDFATQARRSASKYVPLKAKLDASELYTPVPVDDSFMLRGVKNGNGYCNQDDEPPLADGGVDEEPASAHLPLAQLVMACGIAERSDDDKYDRNSRCDTCETEVGDDDLACSFCSIVHCKCS